MPVAGLEGGGETVLASSYVPLITGFRRAERGKMWSEAQQLLGIRQGRWGSVELKPDMHEVRMICVFVW